MGDKNFNHGRDIKADLVSRPNAMNGKYKFCRVGLDLDSVIAIKDKNIFFLETLKMKADLADKMIGEAESQGKDISNPEVMARLGEQINAVGIPLHRWESVMAAIFISLQLMAYYGIAIGIWGTVFKKSFLVFGLYGIILGFLISLLFAAVIAFQRTNVRIKDTSFGIGATWGNLGIIIGAVGLVALLIKVVLNLS